jgi:hypothetical protein
MDNKILIGAGAVILLLYLYKKNQDTTSTEDTNGGGGGGGGLGPIVGGVPAGPITINNIPNGGGGVTPTTPTNPVVLSGLGGAKPVVGVPSNPNNNPINIGIVPISQGGSPTPIKGTVYVPTSSTGVGSSGGVVFGGGGTTGAPSKSGPAQQLFSGGYTNFVDPQFWDFVGNRPKYEFN